MTKVKRQAILDAALKMVSLHGFHGASMALIKEEAGSGAGTIYNYFPSKDELMRELFKEVKIEFVRRMSAGIDPSIPLKEQFFRMWRNLIVYYIQAPEQVAFAQQFHNSPYFDQTCQEFAGAILQPVMRPVEEAMRAGLIRELPFPIFEAFTIDVATSLANRHIHGQIELTDELIESTAELCWSSVAL